MERDNGIWVPDGAALPAAAPPAAPPLAGGIALGPGGVLHARPAEHIAQLPEYDVGVKISLPGNGTVVLGNTYLHVLYVALWDELQGVRVGAGQIKAMGQLALWQAALPRRWWLQAWGVCDSLPHPQLGTVLLDGAHAAA
jgi:hypothetical protein